MSVRESCPFAGSMGHYLGGISDDPTVAGHVEHRKFLLETATFREVGSFFFANRASNSLFQIIPVGKDHILSLIHQNYRIAYIKDTVLPRVLDEGTFGRLNSMLLFNNATLLSFMLKDGTFLSELSACFRVVALRCTALDSNAWRLRRAAQRGASSPLRRPTC